MFIWRFVFVVWLFVFGSEVIFIVFLIFERGDVAVLLFICLIGCEFVFVFVGNCLLFSKGESLVLLLFSSGESFVLVWVVFFFFSCFVGESIILLLLFLSGKSIVFLLLFLGGKSIVFLLLFLSEKSIVFLLLVLRGESIVLFI